MLTRNVFFGLNLLSLGGLMAMGLGLSIARRTRGGRPLGIALMAAGTALAFLGFYMAPPPP